MEIPSHVILNGTEYVVIKYIPTSREVLIVWEFPYAEFPKTRQLLRWGNIDSYDSVKWMDFEDIEENDGKVDGAEFITYNIEAKWIRDQLYIQKGS
jgi:hypothetical protein